MQDALQVQVRLAVSISLIHQVLIILTLRTIVVVHYTISIPNRNEAISGRPVACAVVRAFEVVLRPRPRKGAAMPELLTKNKYK